jgi:8-oxo-dGTP pyrophosphatase MutT (NUDIX family)
VAGAHQLAAAGGVVWNTRGGLPEIAVVHRPRYDDWSLPKGKLDDDESDLAAAVREVREEVGATVAVTRRLARMRYPTAAGTKSVAYWAMRYLGGDFEPSDEVDQVDWLAPEDAAARLTYSEDRSTLANFTATPPPDSVIVLVRHAKAGKSSEWSGDDRLRPLERAGVRQAKRLAQWLAYFAPDRVYSADRTRCIDTVEPLAAQLGVRVRVDPVFSDESCVDSPGTTTTALLALAKPGRVSVVCSQGSAIPMLIDKIGPGVRSSETRKGAWWVLSVVDGDVICADHYDAP